MSKEELHLDDVTVALGLKLDIFLNSTTSNILFLCRVCQKRANSGNVFYNMKECTHLVPFQKLKTIEPCSVDANMVRPTSVPELWS